MAFSLHLRWFRYDECSQLVHQGFQHEHRSGSVYRGARRRLPSRSRRKLFICNHYEQILPAHLRYHWVWVSQVYRLFLPHFYLSVCLLVCLSVCPSIHLSIPKYCVSNGTHRSQISAPLLFSEKDSEPPQPPRSASNVLGRVLEM